MIPQSLAAFLAFLGLVAPGLLFELLRERRRAGRSETAFREASRVALTSFAFTLASLGLLSAVATQWPSSLPNPGRWLDEGETYLVDQYGLVARALLFEVLIACALAAITDWLLKGRARGQLTDASIWYQLLRADRPEGKAPWLHLHLKDGTDFFGNLAYYTPEQRQEDREIALKGPGLLVRSEGKEARPIDDWTTIVVRGDQLSYFKVHYVEELPQEHRGVASSALWRRIPKPRLLGTTPEKQAIVHGSTDVLAPVSGVHER